MSGIIGGAGSKSGVIGGRLDRWKQYSITISGTDSWSTIRGIGIPYQTADGAWRLRFNASATVNTSSGVNFTIGGINCKNITNFNQAISVGTNTGARGYGIVSVANSDTFYIGASLASTQYNVSGDVELEGKPSWAD